MKTPTLVLSVSGGFDCTLNIHFEKEFIETVTHVVLGSDTWIFTNGNKNEIGPRLVGEIVYKNRLNLLRNPNSDDKNVYAIGVSNWANIKNRRELIRAGNTQTSARPSMLEPGDPVERKSLTGRQELEPNHTQFILFDDGTQEPSYDDRYRAHLVRAISQGAQRAIPQITIVLAGGLNTLEATFDDLRAKIPVIIVDNSGPLADLLAKFLKRNAIKETSSISSQKVINDMEYQPEEDDYLKYDEIQNFARDNLSKKTQIPIWIRDELETAIRWSRAEAAKERLYILVNDTIEIKERKELLIKALLETQPTFVDNFLRIGLDLSLILINEETEASDDIEQNIYKWDVRDDLFVLTQYEFDYLGKLYENDIERKTDRLCSFHKMFRETDSEEIDIHEKKRKCTPHILNEILANLIGDYIKPFYTSKTKNRLSSTLFACFRKIEKTRTHNDIKLEYVYRDLFLWSILTHRIEMAKLFLKHMRTRICASLIASKIIRTIVQREYDQAIRHEYEQEANYFESFAIECLTCCYNNDKAYACELVIREVHMYGGVTCLQIAVAADNRKFLHEETCQFALTNIWYDRIEPLRAKYQFYFDLLTFDIPTTIMNLLIQKRSVTKNIVENKNESSYFMLFNFKPVTPKNPIHWTEILTIIIITTMLVEDIRQFLLQDNPLLGKFKAYFDITTQSSNIVLIVPAYILFYVGLIMRFVYKSNDVFSVPRIIMGYDLELWFIRSFLFIGVSRNFGPKLVMIRKMVGISTTQITFAYGVTSRAIYLYGTFEFTLGQILNNIFHPVYYFIYGSYDDERTALKDETDTVQNYPDRLR
ncbi:unnamed protein product [Didymodactylos carnosus]|uniref:TRPM SLOG domain-containing protein n=1 Tax=Didymodactylos carnosus TaxID=1234261 RepID=A0A8S2DC57_9BILA|nr:unnamed protein product [Didymodactylos carnosus]CAF3650399.1 unnamed protein product [Didymodactylos carnosus]